jgi:hypothetical protein
MDSKKIVLCLDSVEERPAIILYMKNAAGLELPPFASLFKIEAKNHTNSSKQTVFE